MKIFISISRLACGFGSLQYLRALAVLLARTTKLGDGLCSKAKAGVSPPDTGGADKVVVFVPPRDCTVSPANCGIFPTSPAPGMDEIGFIHEIERTWIFVPLAH